jgi:hypothetical protein
MSILLKYPRSISNISNQNDLDKFLATNIKDNS